MRLLWRPLIPVLMLLICAGEAGAQTVEQIAANPAKFAGTTVEVTGRVTRYSPTLQQSTGVYLLASDVGAVLRVSTSSGSPDMTRLYRVTGRVDIDPVRKTPLLVEQKRLRLSDQGMPDEPQTAQAPVEEGFPLWLIIIPGLALAGGAAAYVLLTRKKQTPTAEASVEQETTAPPPETSTPSPGELKTIRINPADPMGTLYLPGELVLVTGEDKGRSFRISGFPTPEGFIVTIGRESVTGERGYAHIQIAEKFHTVSRKQAELIWNEEKLLVRNLSETNLTQVNGVKIERGKTAILTPGSRLRTGELEFEYRS